MPLRLHQPWLPLLLLLGACAGRLREGDFYLPPPQVDAQAAPQREVRTSRHPSGELAARWTVLVHPDGRVVKDGREERFHPDGTPAVLQHYRERRQVGEWRRWYPDGSPRSTYEFVPGVATPMRFFHPGGVPSAEGLAVDGLREGEWTFWDASGVVTQAGPYVGGAKEGLWTLRWPSGGLRSRGLYRGSARVGEWRHWPAEPPTLESDWMPSEPAPSAAAPEAGGPGGEGAQERGVQR